MIFLPIVTRELRVAARRKTTFIIRCAVALIGIVIGGFLLFMFEMVGPMGGGGAMVFLVVSRYTLFLALLGGIFLASDCVSEERREGTLGFLFLTDLKGYDVVLGKFTAVSLNAFYGLLAGFPVLALSMLAGGVTAGEFWRTCLTLANTLFVSVAAAIWMSSISKSTYRAMSSAVCLLLGIIVTAIIAYEMSSAVVRFSAPLFYVAAVSPLTSYHLASAANYFRQAGSFWSSLAISNGAGWLFLGLAGWRLSVFTEKPPIRTGWRRIFARDLLAGKTDRRSGLLAVNPVLWILDDSRRMRVLAWAIAIISGALLLTASAFDALGAGTPFLNHYLSWPCYFLLKVLFTIQACRFFSESRRTGALELLCCTPMTMNEIIKGQWMALRRIFLWPVLVLFFSQLACFCFSSRSVFAGAMPDAFMGAYTLYQMVRHVADFFAAGWFGMWLALTIRKPNAAAGLTILYVLVLPTIIFCVPTVATDAVFIIVGFAKLRQDFRIHHVNWVAPQAG
jgi:ABC-type transport system involved in multi-copper enzyme maturation permease subunit